MSSIVPSSSSQAAAAAPSSSSAPRKPVNYFVEKRLEFERISNHIDRLNIPWTPLPPLPVQVPVAVFVVEEQEDASAFIPTTTTIASSSNNVNALQFSKVEIEDVDEGVGTGMPTVNLSSAASVRADPTVTQKRPKRFLVDTSVPGHENIIIETLCKHFDKEHYLSTANPARILNEEIDGILLTHFHFDHAGGCRTLLDLAKKAVAEGTGGGNVPTVFMHNDEIPFGVGDKQMFDLPSKNPLFKLPDVMNRKVPPLTKGAYNCQAVSQLMQTYKQDPPFNCACQSLQYYHTPGHTPGHCSYIHRDDGVMLCGDALMNMFGSISQSLVTFTPEPKTMARNVYQMLKAVDECHTIVPSHHSMPKKKKGDYDSQLLVGIPRAKAIKYLQCYK